METIKIELNFEWDLVYKSPNEFYSFPDKISPYLVENYKRPFIYRWNIFREEPHDLKKIYIGEAINLIRRIKNYIKPGPRQQTSKRINKLLNEFLNQNLKIRLEVLKINYFNFNNLIIIKNNDPEYLKEKYVRRLIEEIMINYYKQKGYKLLNL